MKLLLELRGTLGFYTILLVIAPGVGYGADVARSPSDLVRLVNSHAAFDGQAMGSVDDTAGLLSACSSGKQECSAGLVTVPDSRQAIVILTSEFRRAFLRYVRTNNSGEPDSWAFGGAYDGPFLKDPRPEYAVVQLGGKPYLTATGRGLFGTDVSGAYEDWIDLRAAKFKPVLTLAVEQAWHNPQTPIGAPMEVDCNESIVSWQAGPPETVRVVYRVVLRRAGKPAESKSPTATLVRQGDTFVFDAARSTLSEKDRWGKFDVDAVGLMFR